MCDTYNCDNCDYLKYSAFRFNLIHFQLKTIAIMTSQTQNFLIFWLLILASKSFQIIF